LLVTGCALVFAAGQWLPPIWVAALVLLALSIFAHMAGNAIGTRLREIGGRPDRESVQEFKREPPRFAPTTRLGQRHKLGWPIVIATLTGMILGGFGGGLWTLLTSRAPTPAAVIGLGVVAFAALGGILAFATVGFTQVLLGAIWQAMRHSSGETQNSAP
jgi:amino acid transporter